MSFLPGPPATHPLRTPRPRQSAFSLRDRLRCGCFVSPRAAQDVAEAVVSFVAAVFEDRLRWILCQVHRERPRTGPRVRVVGSHGPLHALRTLRREPLDELHAVRPAAICRAVAE